MNRAQQKSLEKPVSMSGKALLFRSAVVFGLHCTLSAGTLQYGHDTDIMAVSPMSNFDHVFTYVYIYISYSTIITIHMNFIYCMILQYIITLYQITLYYII